MRVTRMREALRNLYRWDGAVPPNLDRSQSFRRHRLHTMVSRDESEVRSIPRIRPGGMV